MDESINQSINLLLQVALVPISAALDVLLEVTGLSSSSSSGGSSDGDDDGNHGDDKSGGGVSFGSAVAAWNTVLVLFLSSYAVYCLVLFYHAAMEDLAAADVRSSVTSFMTGPFVVHVPIQRSIHLYPPWEWQ